MKTSLNIVKLVSGLLLLGPTVANANNSGNEVRVASFFSRAEIRAKNLDGKVVTLYLSPTGTVVGGQTIMDFRKDSPYTEVCYLGVGPGFRRLLKALVDAADDHRVFYITLDSIHYEDGKREYTAIVSAVTKTDEFTESFTFQHCR